MAVPRSARKSGMAGSVRTPSTGPSTGPKTAGPSSFFLKERERLITDIADGMEQLLGNVNTLNRKLEESIVVGQEFEPIANLWGPFVDLLSNHGLQPTVSSEATHAATSGETASHVEAVGATTPGRQREGERNPLSASLDGPSGNRLPPGVAPGGGTVYGVESSSSSASSHGH